MNEPEALECWCLEMVIALKILDIVLNIRQSKQYVVEHSFQYMCNVISIGSLKQSESSGRNSTITNDFVKSNEGQDLG